MNETVQIDYAKRAIQGFKLRARNASPNELVGFLLGEISNSERRIFIHKVVYPPVHKNTTENMAWFSYKDLCKEQEKYFPLRFVGTIHSHPNTTTDPSERDIVTAAELNEICYAIYGFWTDEDGVERNKLSWYLGTPMVKAVAV